MEFPPLHGRREPLEKSILVVERNRKKMRPKIKIKIPTHKISKTNIKFCKVKKILHMVKDHIF
jgi:hypothetical protein